VKNDHMEGAIFSTPRINNPEELKQKLGRYTDTTGNKSLLQPLLDMMQHRFYSER